VDIVRGYSIFKDKEKSIRLALARFDKDTQEAFYNLYTKIDPTINPVPEVPAQPQQMEQVKQTTAPTTVSI
jgi:hypothetical protein